MNTFHFAELPDDSPEFLRAASEHAITALESPLVRSIFISRVRGWFGERWLGFSGKALGAVGVKLFDLTVPPFVPSRITSTVFLARTPEGSFAEAEPPFVLHPKQASVKNLRRNIRELAPSSGLFWLSTSRLTSGRGALMSYLPRESGGHAGQYLGFALTPQLRVTSNAQFPKVDDRTA